MIVPLPGPSSPIQRITPSLYNAATLCPARALWAQRAVVFPSTPSAVLGQAFHAVTEAATRNELPVNGEERARAARALFAVEAENRFLASHAVLRGKFNRVDLFPGYFLNQARAAQAALSIPSGSSMLHRDRAHSMGRLAEQRLASSDGLLVGRIDLIDVPNKTVGDYKTGRKSSEELISDNELRQLRLYTYLCGENGITIERGAIYRAGQRKDVVTITPSEAEKEAAAARETLQYLNDSIQAGCTQDDVATPSPKACHNCPYRPACGAFWHAASPQWRDSVGLCVEGQVEQSAVNIVLGKEMMSLQLQTRRGTVEVPRRISCALQPWAAGGDVVAEGELVRVVDASLTDNDSRLVSAGFATTTLWRISHQV